MNFCPGSKNSIIGEKKTRKPEDMTELSTNYLLRLNVVHRNYICKLRTSRSNIKFPIKTRP